MQEDWVGKDAHEILSMIGPYKLYFWDIARIGPNQELESEVLSCQYFIKTDTFLSSAISNQL